jgi:hypothetical protein
MNETRLDQALYSALPNPNAKTQGFGDGLFKIVTTIDGKHFEAQSYTYNDTFNLETGELVVDVKHLRLFNADHCETGFMGGKLKEINKPLALELAKSHGGNLRQGYKDIKKIFKQVHLYHIVKPKSLEQVLLEISEGVAQGKNDDDDLIEEVLDFLITGVVPDIVFYWRYVYGKEGYRKMMRVEVG